MERTIAAVTEVCDHSGCHNVDVDASAIAGFLAFLGGFIGIVIILALLVFAFWVWMLVDAIGRDEESYKKVNAGERTLWILILIISLFLGLSWLSAILYYFIVRKKAKDLEVKPKKKS
ncbi:MAG: hypothetical protein PHW75_02555 [Patescibacteria group bacterium]|nr:hypothetical protein [Patescibacteria group bacterium]